jgi:hypothetical protein
MSEMVERVARALCEQSYAKSDEKLPWYWHSETSDERDEWRAMARAAIEAMREPTDRMCNSGAAKWDDDWCTETNALNMWQAMIDEALK